MPWTIHTDADEARTDAVCDGLVAHNQASSEMVRRRFEPEHLASRPVVAYALDEAGDLLGGCVGSTEDLWQWLTIDMLWLRPDERGSGIGRALVEAVEAQARDRGCRWAKLNTWEFQAPEFYAACGYQEYGREVDYPPGHVNYLMRKDL